MSVYTYQLILSEKKLKPNMSVYTDQLVFSEKKTTHNMCIYTVYRSIDILRDKNNLIHIYTL